MSDLCYNCHQMHLPRICQHPLQECLNCGTFGHTWNFCHRGAHRLAPDYKYFALCHNCQKWHLPMPCEEELAQCGGCGQFGHLQEYCALDPSPSALFTTSMTSFIAYNLNAKDTQRIIHSAALADQIYNIKMGAVMDTLKLCTGSNSSENVRLYLANAYRGLPHHIGTTSHHSVPNHVSVSRQLPTPAAVKTEINPGLPLPRPSVPQAQIRNSLYNTLAPIQLQDSKMQPYRQLEGPPAVVDENRSSYTTSYKIDAAPDDRKTLGKSHPTHDGVLNFRAYDANVDGNEEEVEGDSPGDGSFTPLSSPCDARANSMEGKNESEQEREFFEGSIF